MGEQSAYRVRWCGPANREPLLWLNDETFGGGDDA